jgi:uncharacterized protein (TIGR02588 family)
MAAKRTSGADRLASGGSGARRTKRRQARRGGGGTSPWEWAAAIIGAGILAGIVGFLFVEEFQRDAAYADMVVTAGEIRPAAGQPYRVPIFVENVGDLTGAGVMVRGVLRDSNGSVVEESAVTFDFVAQHAKTAGGLFFTRNPSDYRLELRAEGYTDPWPRPADVTE